MKIFFSVTPRAKKIYNPEIKAIYKSLKQLGHDLTDTYIENISEKEFYGWNSQQKYTYYQNSLKFIRDSHIAIFEASTPSIGVGHLINVALNFGKPVIILYKLGKAPFLLESANNSKVILIEYRLDNLTTELDQAIEYAKEAVNIRFNLFLSSKLNSYLAVISEKYDISKSAFIRGLIYDHMRKFQ